MNWRSVLLSSLKFNMPYIWRAYSRSRWYALSIKRRFYSLLPNKELKWWQGPLYVSIDPNIVQFRCRFAPTTAALVCPGDWDLKRTKVDKPVVREILAGVSLPETSIYRDYCESIQHGDYASAKNIRSVQELDLYLERKKEMILEIQSGIYKTTRDTGGFISDDVTIYLDRDGIPHLANAGAHRLVAAQAVGLGSIPVFLRLIHQDYWETCFQGHPSGTIATILSRLEGGLMTTLGNPPEK